MFGKAGRVEVVSLRLIGIFSACILLVVIVSFIIGMITGFMLGIFSILILAALLTGVISNRLESRRKRELEKEGLE